MPAGESSVILGLVLFLLLTTMPPCVYTQQSALSFETLPIDQGAPTHVSCILQDRTGYMWIGTWSGLHRYDGYGFVTYKHNPADTSSLAHNAVFTLYEDKAGVLWIGSPIGLDRLDQATGRFKHYTPNPSIAENDSSNRISQVYEGRNGAFWVGTGFGLRMFDRRSGEFLPLKEDTSDAGSVPVGSIYEDNEGTLWVGTATGLARYDTTTRTFIYCWSDPGNRQKLWINSPSVHWINSICGDENGRLWLGTNGGLVEYNLKERTFLTYRYSSADLLNPQHPENRIISMCQTGPSEPLWIGSRSGLFSFDRQSKTFTHQLDQGVTSVCGERSGTLWVGMNTGIRKLNRPRHSFIKVPMGDIACALVNGNAEIIWVYAYKKGGWLRFDLKTSQFVPYAFGTDYLYYAYPGGDLSFLKTDGSFYICDTLGKETFSLGPSSRSFNHSFSFGWKTHRGYYVGTHGGGLYLFDPETRGVTEIRKVKQGIYYIYEDTFGLLWVASHGGGLFSYDQANNTFADDVGVRRNPSGVSGREINQIYEDAKGRIWFATSAGLDRYERSTNGFTCS